MLTLFAYGSFGSYGSYANESILSGILQDFLSRIIIVILGLILGLVVFFVFMPKKNEGKYTGFLGWLYDFLNFKILLSQGLLKALYAISAATLILSSLYKLLFTEGGSIGAKLLAFVLTFVLGNIILRIVYEFMLFIILICKNTSDINSNLEKFNSKFEENSRKNDSDINNN
jgi:hypothetical protein